MGQTVQAFVEKDMEMLEIKPSLIVTDGGEPESVGRKVSFDATQMYRHGDIADSATPPKKTPKKSSVQYDLNYIALAVKSAAWLNGAGLAMAHQWESLSLRVAEPRTSDLWRRRPKRKLTEAFKIITSDPQVKVSCGTSSAASLR